MPKQVRGEDGRVLHVQLGDSDAHDLALRVNRETGETVSLVPWVFNGEEYVLEPESVSVVATPAVEDEPGDEPDPLGDLPTEGSDTGAEVESEVKPVVEEDDGA